MKNIVLTGFMGAGKTSVSSELSMPSISSSTKAEKAASSASGCSSNAVRCSGGAYEVVQGLDINDFSRGRMDDTEKELREERAAIEELL